jgi:integrase
MAVFRKIRGQNKTRWQAVIRKRGHALTRTFDRKDIASDWAAEVEAAISRATKVAPFKRDDWLHESSVAVDLVLGDATDRPHTAWTLGRALQHYEETVTTAKKGAKQESDRIRIWRGRPIANRQLSDIGAAEIQNHIDSRVVDGKAAMTVRNEVLLLSALYAHAAAPPRPGGGEGGGWGLPGLINPVGTCHLPSPPAGRDRRLQAGHGDQPGEEDRILAALAADPTMTAVVIIALETGMRLSEILDVRPEQIHRMHGGTRYVSRPDSKNMRPRRVVLSPRAEVVLDSLLANADLNRPLIRIGLHTVENRWRAACRRAGVEDLTMHDLRHEALSRMASKGLTIGELQAQSGHRTAQVLLRYVNARAEDVAAKLR